MNPVSIDIIIKKKRLILRELDLLSTFRQIEINAESELLKQHALCHSMQNLISAVIDICQHIATESGKEYSSYYQSIQVLGDLGVLDPEFADDFARVAKLRNVLVHLYDDINIEHLYSLMPKLIDHTKRFLLAIQDVT